MPPCICSAGWRKRSSSPGTHPEFPAEEIDFAASQEARPWQLRAVRRPRASCRSDRSALPSHRAGDGRVLACGRMREHFLGQMRRFAPSGQYAYLHDPLLCKHRASPPTGRPKLNKGGSTILSEKGQLPMSGDSRKASRHRQHRGAHNDRADSRAPRPSERVARSSSPEPHTAQARAVTLTRLSFRTGNHVPMAGSRPDPCSNRPAQAFLTESGRFINPLESRRPPHRLRVAHST